MAGDAVQIGADHKVRIKDDKIVIAGAGDPCCCEPGYIRVHRCRDDEPTDYWVFKSDYTLPFYFKLDEVCYYIEEGNDEETEIPEGGSVPDTEDDQEDCTPCEYIQAKSCRTHATADLWRLASDGVPYYFSKSSVCYYIEDGNPTSDTPGTLLTGETSKTSCLNCSPPCSPFCPDGTPFRYTVSLTGLNLCNTTCTARAAPPWFPSSDKCDGAAPTGTFTLERTTEVSCVWQITFPHVIRQRIWGNDPACGGTPTFDGSSTDCTITLTRTSSTAWSLTVSLSGGGVISPLFSGTKTTGVSSCLTGFEISSTYTVCYPGLGPYDGLATGGTATVTAI